MNVYTTQGIIRGIRRFCPAGQDIEPSSRWWRTRQQMRSYIEDVGLNTEAVRAHMLKRLGLLPGVWNEQQYAERMETIRTLGIDLCHEGAICNGGLNEFLETFGMEEFNLDTCDCDDPQHNRCGQDGYTCDDSDCETCYPTKDVEVTVRIRLTVKNSADTYETERDVERYLVIELSGNVDDADLDAADIDITDVDVQRAH